MLCAPCRADALAAAQSVVEHCLGSLAGLFWDSQQLQNKHWLMCHWHLFIARTSRLRGHMFKSEGFDAFLEASIFLLSKACHWLARCRERPCGTVFVNSFQALIAVASRRQKSCGKRWVPGQIRRVGSNSHICNTQKKLAALRREVVVTDFSDPLCVLNLSRAAGQSRRTSYLNFTTIRSSTGRSKFAVPTFQFCISRFSTCTVDRQTCTAHVSDDLPWQFCGTARHCRSQLHWLHWWLQAASLFF